MDVNDNNYLQELFLDEAKSALNAHSPVNDDQIEDIVTDYLDENPVESATATIVGNVLVVA